MLLKTAIPGNSQKYFYKFPIVPWHGRIFYVETSNNRFYYSQLYEMAKYNNMTEHIFPFSK